MYFLIRYLIRVWKRRQAAVASPAPGGLDGPVPAVRPAAVPPGGDGPSAASRGRLALFAHQCRYDITASIRNPRARFMGLIFPLLLLVVFNGVFGSGHTTVDGVRVALKVFYVPGILAMSIVVNAYAGLVISISALRETGVLKRRRASPVPAVMLIGGQAVATLLSTVVSSTLLLVIARFLYGVGLSGPAILAIACSAVVGTLAFACIGYAVSGLIGSPEAAQPIVQATMLPLWFISGVFIPVSSLSRGLRDVGDVFPVQPLANSLHLASVHSSFGAALSGVDLLVLVAWGVGAAGFAAWRFSWLPSGAAG